MERVMSGLGIFVMLGIAYSLSKSRKNIDFRLIVWGLGLQALFTLLVLGVPVLGVPGVLGFLFSWANDFFLSVIEFTDKGSEFIFGPLIDPVKSQGFIFAVKVLPSIIFFSSLMAIGYHLGIMQKIVRGLALVMQKTMRTSGAETLSTAANIFVGQTEAPLMIKPYVKSMTHSELLTVMAGGMANAAGGVMVAYVAMLYKFIPDIAGHLMTVSVLTAPATLVIAKTMLPELEKPLTQGQTQLKEEAIVDANIIEAAARGASEGMSLAINVAAMLIAFIALVAMANGLLAWFGGLIHFETWGQGLVPELLKSGDKATLSLQLIFGWVLSPIAFVMGVPWNEATVVGALLGEKTALNEFVAYLHLAELGDKLSPRSMLIASYALCGFANFSSIAIQIGGIGSMAPERRSDIARLGISALIAGTLATFMSACFAGLVV
jgi:CNT family concentrative nucleoside transporter